MRTRSASTNNVKTRSGIAATTWDKKKDKKKGTSSHNKKEVVASSGPSRTLQCANLIEFLNVEGMKDRISSYLDPKSTLAMYDTTVRFRKQKFSDMRWALNYVTSWLYFTDNTFYKNKLKTIKNYSLNYSTHTDLETFHSGLVRSTGAKPFALDFSYCSDIRSLLNFPTGNYEKVSFDGCSMMTHIFGLTGQLVGIEIGELSFRHCRGLRGSLYVNQCKTHTIDLSYCTAIVEVGMLESVANVNLTGCTGVIDVSGLCNATNLNISECKSIRDVNCLTSVKNLIMRNCKGVTDVSQLGAEQHSIDLSGCNGISDVSSLANVHTLDISHCPLITDVNVLTGVVNLRMQKLESITSLLGLRSVRQLDASYCPGVDNLRPISQVVNLNLRGCTGITDASDLSSLPLCRTLDLSFCTGIVDVSPLRHVLELNLSGCTGITDVTCLDKVHSLDLRGCTSIDKRKAESSLKITVRQLRF